MRQTTRSPSADIADSSGLISVPASCAVKTADPIENKINITMVRTMIFSARTSADLIFMIFLSMHLYWLPCISSVWIAFTDPNMEV